MESGKSGLRQSASRAWHAGVKLSWLNILAMVIGLALGVGMVYAIYQTDETSARMMAAAKSYVLSQQTSGMLGDFSEAMEKEVSDFLETGDPSHVHAFYGQMEAIRGKIEEANALGQRGGKIADQYLSEALEHFTRLMEQESYAIRLMADSLPIPLTAYPEKMAEMKLTEEDAAKTPEEKKAAAAALMQSETVSEFQEKVAECVDNSHRASSDEIQKQMDETESMLNRLRFQQNVLISLFLLVAAASLVLNWGLIIRPINRSAAKLDSREKIPVRGSYETRHLAKVYNDMLRDNEEKREALSYAASHDALTGLFNRADFDRVYREYKAESIGVLVADVDHFKLFNDEYGHDIGDRVLKKVADALRTHFRSEDHISRIGGDEFCVIMRKMDSSQAGTVQEKIRQINQLLASDEEDDLPPISISAGVAFSDREKPGPDIFKDADMALLQGKRHGRTVCQVYGPETREDDKRNREGISR